MMGPIQTPPFERDEVFIRLEFGAQRLDDLLKLNGGFLPGANAHERLQLLQEFFFHVTGSLDVLAQHVNDRRQLKLDPEVIDIHKVMTQLTLEDPLKGSLTFFCIKTRKQPPPPDLYSEKGYMFRILVYRNHVTHRHRNPLDLEVLVGENGKVDLRTAKTYPLLDPRNPNSPRANRTVQEELPLMLELVSKKCDEALQRV
jgi:hypothetical protein